MSDDARAGGKRSFRNILRAATRENRNIFAEIRFRDGLFYGSNDLRREGGDGYTRKNVRRNGEAFYGGAIICVHLSGKY